MKSYAIKLLDKDRVNYFINEFTKSPMNIYMSNYKFKIYENVIIHFPINDLKCLNELNEFNNCFYKIIKGYIEEFYESKIIKRIINKNYFYLNYIERDYIYEITKKVLELPDSKIGNINRKLKNNIINYIKNNKKIYIDGFIEFRLQEYKEILEKLVEVSVYSFLDLTSF